MKTEPKTKPPRRTAKPKKNQKPKRTGNYGKNRGKKYNKTPKTDPSPTKNPDEFSIEMMEEILAKHDDTAKLIDPSEEKERKKAAEKTDYIEIDNDPDEDPEKEQQSEKSEEQKKEEPKSEEKKYSLKDHITADMVISALESLGYYVATKVCEKSGKLIITRDAAKYTEIERAGMRPGAEKMIEAILSRFDNPIGGMVAIAAIHTIGIIWVSPKDPNAKKPEKNDINT